MKNSIRYLIFSFIITSFLGILTSIPSSLSATDKSTTIPNLLTPKIIHEVNKFRINKMPIIEMQAIAMMRIHFSKRNENDFRKLAQVVSDCVSSKDAMNIYYAIKHLHYVRKYYTVVYENSVGKTSAEKRDYKNHILNFQNNLTQLIIEHIINKDQKTDKSKEIYQIDTIISKPKTKQEFCNTLNTLIEKLFEEMNIQNYPLSSTEDREQSENNQKNIKQQIDNLCPNYPEEAQALYDAAYNKTKNLFNNQEQYLGLEKQFTTSGDCYYDCQHNTYDPSDKPLEKARNKCIDLLGLNNEPELEYLTNQQIHRMVFNAVKRYKKALKNHYSPDNKQKFQEEGGNHLADTAENIKQLIDNELYPLHTPLKAKAMEGAIKQLGFAYFADLYLRNRLVRPFVDSQKIRDAKYAVDQQILQCSAYHEELKKSESPKDILPLTIKTISANNLDINALLQGSA